MERFRIIHPNASAPSVASSFSNVMHAALASKFAIATSLARVAPHRVAERKPRTAVIECAHKKGTGSTKNGRDSNPKYLGVKKFGEEKVQVGSIIVRQRGNKVRRAIRAKRARRWAPRPGSGFRRRREEGSRRARGRSVCASRPDRDQCVVASYCEPHSRRETDRVRVQRVCFRVSRSFTPAKASVRVRISPCTRFATVRSSSRLAPIRRSLSPSSTRSIAVDARTANRRVRISVGRCTRRGRSCGRR